MADTPDQATIDAYNQMAAGNSFTPGKATPPRQPIGVPSGYVAPFRKDNRGVYGPMAAGQFEDQVPGGFGGQQGIGARYYEDNLEAIAGLSPEATTQLQFRLKDAGLLKTFLKGVWGQDENDAMVSVFSYANRQGLAWEDALDDFAGMAQMVKDATAGPKFTARLSNPDDLKKAFTQSLYDAQGGRFMDDTQMQQMVDAYQQIEFSSQRAAFDNAATVEDAPTAQTFAATEAKKADPTGVAAAKFADYGQVFEDLVGQ